MNTGSNWQRMNRRRFLKNSVKVSAAACLLPAALPESSSAQASCAKPYGSGLYGTSCFPGKTLLKVLVPQTNIRMDGFKVYLDGDPGKTYEIQGSQDFVAWQTISSVTMPAGGDAQLVHDSAATNLNHRFYRALPQ